MTISRWDESTTKTLVPQARQSEWHSTMDGLRTSEMSVLYYLIIWGTHSLAVPCTMVTRFCHPFLAGRSLLGWHGWSESWAGSYCAADHHKPAWMLGSKVTGHPPEFISTQLWSPGTYPTARTLSSAKIFAFWVPKTLPFPNLNILCGEAQTLVSLLIAGFVFYVSIHWRIQDMPLLFQV